MVERSYLLKIFMLIYQKCWKFFMCLIFVGQGYPRKLFNLEHFLIYGILRITERGSYSPHSPAEFTTDTTDTSLTSI